MAQIYRDHLAMVQRRALRITNNRDLAEDVAHEVFVKFMRYSSKYDVENTAALLYRMATQIAIKRLRMGLRQVALPERREVADRSVRVIEDQLALKKVLGLMSPEDAQIAAYYYVDGMSQNAIEKQLGVKRRTVGRALEHFCERARRLLNVPAGSPAPAPPEPDEAEIAEDEASVLTPIPLLPRR